MADLSTEIDRWTKKMYESVGPAAMKRIGTEAGMAGKKAGLDVAERDAGADRVLSGFRRKSAKLNVGFDIVSATRVDMNFRGPWALMNTGRKAKGDRIVPKARRGGTGKALSTPWGPRASVRSSSWAGKGTLVDAERQAEDAVPKAAFKQLQSEIARQLKG